MCEFIVWDKDNYFGEDNQFHELDKFFNEGLSVHYETDNGLVIINYDAETDFGVEFLNIETFDYIGKKDINGNKIYADCSIFKFKWGQNEHEIIGYFKYNNDYLSCEIIMINAQVDKSMNYDPNTCVDIEIIDTLQQNKLGLIK